MEDLKIHALMRWACWSFGFAGSGVVRQSRWGCSCFQVGCRCLRKNNAPPAIACRSLSPAGNVCRFASRQTDADRDPHVRPLLDTGTVSVSRGLNCRDDETNA